ncbi:unnamed protein product, partial [Onchocerca flexuosa]|uniref:Uncharacterized protein n=1 Tax=Onchocerca flexuosa TaxID=387005 RepID=A0A183HVE2_9BILA
IVLNFISEKKKKKKREIHFRIVGERVTHRDRLSQQHRPARPQSWASTISTDSIRSSDTTTDSSVMDGNGNNPNGTCCSSPSSGSPTFVPVMSDEDPDNNVSKTTNDPLQTRSHSCPEVKKQSILNFILSLTINSLGGLSPLSSSSISTTVPSSGILNTIIPSSILAKSLITTTTTTTTTPLNTIVESSSSTELFATI